MHGYEYEVRFEEMEPPTVLHGRVTWHHRTVTVHKGQGEALVQHLRHAEMEGQRPRALISIGVYLNVSNLVRCPRMYSRPKPVAWERVL